MLETERLSFSHLMYGTIFLRTFPSSLFFISIHCMCSDVAFKKLANMKYLLQLFDLLKLIRDLNMRFVQHIQESLTTQAKTIPDVFYEFAPCV